MAADHDSEPKDVEAELIDDGGADDSFPADKRAPRPDGAPSLSWLRLGVAGVVCGVIISAVSWILGARSGSDGAIIEAALEARAARERLQAAEARLAEVESAAAGAARLPTVANELAALADDVEDLTDRLDGVDGAAGPAARAEIAALATRLDVHEELVNDMLLAAQAGAATTAPPAPRLEDAAIGDAGSGAAAARAEALAAEVALLTDRLNRVQARQAETAEALEAQNRTTAQLETAVDERLDRLESVRIEGLAERTALMIAFTNMRDAALAGRPYRTHYDTVLRLTKKRPVFATLERYADAGLPTEDRLKADFSAAAEAALAAERRADADGLPGDLMAGLQDVFSVRPKGDAAGDGLGARLARAELKVEAGDYGLALQELKGLSGPGAAALEPWIAATRARLALAAALETVHADILRTLPEG